jgi:type IX secretion system PorP/SprF family membrane protein
VAVYKHTSSTNIQLSTVPNLAILPPYCVNSNLKRIHNFYQNLLILRRILYLCLLLAVWVVPVSLQAQDIHFSQFNHSPTNLNPALTGIFRGQARFSGHYRSQWNTVPVEFLTFAASADFKVANRDPNRNGFLALGGAFNYDQAGLSRLYLVNANLNLSYTLRLHPKAFLSAGFQAGASNRGFNLQSLLFNSQYNRNTSEGDPGLPHGVDFPSNRNSFFDLGTGLNFRLQDFSTCEIVNDLSKRSSLDVGVGLFHINRPNQAFDDEEEADLFLRISPYLLGNLQIDNTFDVFLHTNFQFQGPYQEWLVGLGGRAYFDKTPGKQVSIAASLGYRFNQDFGDAFIPAFEVQVGPVFGTISYDVNISDFNVATGRQGGWELSVRYVLGRVCIRNYFCPLL